MRIVVVETLVAAAATVALLREDIAAGNCFCGVDAKGQEFRGLGFDTETKPKFHAGGLPNPVALIQLASSTTVALFRVCCFDLVACTELLHLLMEERVLKIGVGAATADLDAIRTLLPRFTDYGSFFDCTPCLQARWPSLRRLGLRNAAATLLGVRVAKAQQMKNWAMGGPLTKAMQRYAACDACIGLELFQRVCGKPPLITPLA
jgi:ribonuclease D